MISGGVNESTVCGINYNAELAKSFRFVPLVAIVFGVLHVVRCIEFFVTLLFPVALLELFLLTTLTCSTAHLMSSARKMIGCTVLPRMR